MSPQEGYANIKKNHLEAYEALDESQKFAPATLTVLASMASWMVGRSLGFEWVAFLWEFP